MDVESLLPCGYYVVSMSLSLKNDRDPQIGLDHITVSRNKVTDILD